MTPNGILLSTAYFAPVHFYSRVLNHSEIYIEQFENFSKQTYRNRSVIMGGNGPITLVVPVIKGRGPKILIKDLKVSYDMDWQRNQWRTIFSAYNSSPFFEYYQDEIQPYFNTKYSFLLDLNTAIHGTICDLLEIENNIIFTKDFEKVSDDVLNFREVISPKNKTQKDSEFIPANYTQVFSEKFGFIPNISILDLLFNEGPNSYTILEKSISKGYTR